ncbi:MAG: UDP-N-acetylmuramate--L-alanine ligase [Bacteroidota bacterium]
MELNAIKQVYFVGIGGIGMSALARYFLNRGCKVSGYDKTATPLTQTLENEGMSISYVDEVSSLLNGMSASDEELLVVYTPAIPKESIILNYFAAHNFELKKRSEVLGIISKGQFCIAVAGTHGKTTTSSIVAHLLTDTGFGCTAFLGGIATNFNSNFVLGSNDVVVVEADEYDRSFLTLYPDIAVITSMDADHLDIYGDQNQLHESFKLFANQIKTNGTLFVKSGLPIASGITYSIENNDRGGAKAHNIRIEDSKFVFDYSDGLHAIAGIKLALPGRHNIENTTVAIAVALKAGVDPLKISSAVASFKGVKRRFEYVVVNSTSVYIDDYAHHPEELRACFDAVRELYPNKKMTVIFQPHLFTRTRDFADDFAKVLGTSDELLLLEIYPARERPIEGINSHYLLDKIQLANTLVVGKEEVLEIIKHKQPELLVTVGAGDIDTLVTPLKAILDHV